MSYEEIVKSHIKEGEILLQLINLLQAGASPEQLEELEKRELNLINIISSLNDSLEDEKRIAEKVAAEPLPF